MKCQEKFLEAHYRSSQGERCPASYPHNKSILGGFYKGSQHDLRFCSELRFCQYICRVILYIQCMFQFVIVGTCKLDILASAYPALQRHFSETNKLHKRQICKDSDTRRRYCIEQICAKMLLHALKLTKYQSRHNLADSSSFCPQNTYCTQAQSTGYRDLFKFLVLLAKSHDSGWRFN